MDKMEKDLIEGRDKGENKEEKAYCDRFYKNVLYTCFAFAIMFLVYGTLSDATAIMHNLKNER